MSRERESQDRDLFGLQVGPPPPKHKVSGYAQPPGTGPAGETCKTCRHAYAREFGRTYHKCDLVRATNGPGTDIRLRSPACRAWEKRESGGGA